MPDVRAEDRVESGAHRVRAAVEGPPIDGVVGLATEIEARDEEVADVLLFLDLAPEVVVEIRIEHAGPADPALEEGEVQVGEAAGHPAEEERLADGMAGGGEMADVVIAEIGRGVAQEDRPRAVVEARRDLELPALGPHGVVVVVAVDP